MDYNTPENLAACAAIVKTASRLLYYSHIPTAGVALLIGIFVLWKDRGSLISKILLAMSVAFALWTTIDLIVWFGYAKNTLLMFAWSFFGILNTLIYILSLYFVYVFVDKKDISFNKKFILGSLFLPVILLTPTWYNLTEYDTVNCIAVEGKYFTNYFLLLGLFVAVWILALAIVRYKKAQKEFKKQILFLTFGISFFLLFFFTTEFLAGYLIDNGYIANGDYSMEQYGLFGMPVFMAFLAYLIVKYKAFNIKLLGAQALVVALVALIGSQFFFTPLDNSTNVILISVTVLIAVIMGIYLVRSVKLEVQRKEELQNMSDKLAQANDQLRKLDNAKSEFISIASHQLRTPLTAIKGFVSLLLEGSYGKLDPTQEDVLNKVYTSNDRLVNLVEDLLNISRIESGRMEFKFAPWQVADICQEVIDTFVLKAKDHNLYLEYKKPQTPLPEILIDGGKVREVISNMVDNAVKYTPKGGVTLKVEKVFGDVQKVAGEVGAIRVTVSDTGIGIPQEELPYLFSKFSRGKDTSRLNTGGTGLGLYVGQQMIEQNGGRIWAESDGANLGSRFIIELPVQQDKELLEKWG